LHRKRRKKAVLLEVRKKTARREPSKGIAGAGEGMSCGVSPATAALARATIIIVVGRAMFDSSVSSSRVDGPAAIFPRRAE